MRLFPYNVEKIIYSFISLKQSLIDARKKLKKQTTITVTHVEISSIWMFVRVDGHPQTSGPYFAIDW